MEAAVRRFNQQFILVTWFLREQNWSHPHPTLREKLSRHSIVISCMQASITACMHVATQSIAQFISDIYAKTGNTGKLAQDFTQSKTGWQEGLEM